MTNKNNKKKSNKKRIVNLLKVIIPLIIGFYLLWYFYDAMDADTKEVFYNAIEGANYFWIILSMGLGFVSHLIRAYRWKYTLEPLGETPKFWHRYHALMIGYLVNLLIPRAGEATRAALLYQTDRIPFSKSFGTIIAERVFDLFLLGLIVLLAISINMEDLIAIKDIIVNGAPGSDGGESLQWLFSLLLSVAIGVGLLFIILWFTIDTFQRKVRNFIMEVLDGILSIFHSKKPFQFIFYSVSIWVLYITFFGLCFQAFPQTQHFPFGGVLVGFIAGTFGLMFTNGGIGAYPYLVGIVVIYFIGDQFESHEMAEGVGKALGMVIWLSQTVMMLILGLISLVLLPRNYKKEKNDKVGAHQAQDS